MGEKRNWLAIPHSLTPMPREKKIDWLNHFLEFIVVVIGILLAFQLNSCSQDRQQQEHVTQHITKIVEESQFNHQLLQQAVENSEGLLALLDETLGLLADDEPNVAALSGNALRLLALDYIYIKTKAYHTLTETGDIRLIKDSQLQNNIVALYEYYNWITGVDQSTRETYRDNYLAYAIQHFDLVTHKPQDLSVYTDPVFINSLGVYRYSIDFRLQKLKEVLGHNGDFLAIYDPEYETE